MGEIEQGKVQVIFDGASFDGECFVLMFRFIKNWKFLQRVVQVSLLEKSLNNRNIAAEIINCIGRSFRVPPEQIRGMAYDS